LRVLSLESRRSREIAHLISNQGGRPTVAPSTREISSGPHPDGLRFAAGIREDQFGMVIFLTGVGTRALAQAIEPVCSASQFAAALSRTTVVARGPKPAAALRELGVPIAVHVPEPNTWREILQALDQAAELIPLRGRQVAVQEHGEPSLELYAGLRERGALVFPVRVYQWALPEDTGPLREAVTALSRRQLQVALFTASVQVHHLLEVAGEMQLRDDVVQSLQQMMIASIGPITSLALRDAGVAVDFEPSHPKMGFLVKEAAEHSAEILDRKRDQRTPHGEG
jgi:uroporphyrinogen-III synthase